MGKLSAGEVFESNSYGKLVVLLDRGWDKVDIEFVDTGFRCESKRYNIINGSLKDPTRPVLYGVGFVGVGEYSSATGKSGVHNRIYKTWSSMFKRCYSGKGYPSYKGCTVCDEWHNFQNFAKWYTDNYPDDGNKYDLDKDIKVSGNKIYSPSSCMFVTPFANKSKAKSKTCVMISPDGVETTITSVRQFCIKHGLNQQNFNRVTLGQRDSCEGWTLPQPKSITGIM